MSCNLPTGEADFDFFMMDMHALDLKRLIQQGGSHDCHEY